MVKIWVTQIRAIDPEDGEMKLWAGPDIEAETYEAACAFVQSNGLGYCEVIGELVEEIPEVLANCASILYADERKN
jgi:hypothetical protein